ncbi:MAG: hypothetical protein V4598_04760 [Bdellovibrionota bacterium]
MSLLIVTFTSSFCSMCFSMIMALVMTEFTGEEVYTQCLTVGPYLLGLGIGSAFADNIKNSERMKRLWHLEWASVVAIPIFPVLQLLAVFLFIHLSPLGVNLDSRLALQVLLSCTSVLAFFSGILGGAQLPLIISEDKKHSEELLLAINYIGPLFAGIFVVSLSGRAVPVAMQLFIVGMIQLAGIFALVKTLPGKKVTTLGMIFIPLGVLILATHFYPTMERYTVKASYLRTKSTLSELLNPAGLLKVIDGYGTLERVRTTYQTIDLLIEPPDTSYGIPGNATLYLNRKPQFDLLSADVYHQTMVYGAFNLLKRTPKSVLILGAGDGLLLNELSPHKIPEVLMVELDGGMIEWSRTNPSIATLNRGSLDSLPPGSTLLIDDAISFLRRNRGQKRFDLILVDLPFPNGPDLAKLYSQEFYRLVRSALSMEGLVVIDLPLYINQDRELSPESKMILKTMHAAGFPEHFSFGPLAAFVALSPEKRNLAFDHKNFPDGLSLASYTNFVSPFRDDEITPEEWAKIPVNTMFWPKEF